MNRRTFLLAAALLPSLPAWAKRVEQGLFVAPAPKPMPPLEIRDNDSRSAGLDGLRGKPVLVNLWASWCMPCVAELPALDRLKPLIEQDVHVMALCLDRSGNIGATNTYARLGIRNLDVRVDTHRKAGEVWGAAVLPTTLLIDAQGNEVARFIGPAAWDGPEALALLRALAAGKPLTPAMAPPLVKITAAP